MSYFPESIMPPRIKDETSDINGNKYIISASDINKHDEEIRAIQNTLGAIRANYIVGVSGSGCDAEGSYSGFSFAGPQIPPKVCTQPDVQTALFNIVNLLKKIRDEHVSITSGILKTKGNGVLATSISLPFPGTYLDQEVADNSTSQEGPIDMISSLKIGSTTGFPESGYISVLNDVYPLIFDNGSRTLRILGYITFAGSTTVRENNVSTTSVDEELIFGLGNNIEIMQYENIDYNNNILLNVSRRSLGTFSTRHSRYHLVFPGRLSLQVAPLMYTTKGKIDHFECYVDHLSNVNTLEAAFALRQKTNNDYGAIQDYVYLSYQASLIKDIDVIPEFDPKPQGECS